jgi:hypothetical protein
MLQWRFFHDIDDPVIGIGRNVAGVGELKAPALKYRLAPFVFIKRPAPMDTPE